MQHLGIPLHKIGLRRGFSIYLIYMAQEYPAVLPYHSVASTDRYDHYFKIPPARPVSRPACHGSIPAHRRESRYRRRQGAAGQLNVDAQELLLLLTMAELLVQAAHRRLPGSDPVLADLAHRLGACLRRRDGQLSAEEAVAAPDFSIFFSTTNASNRY